MASSPGLSRLVPAISIRMARCPTIGMAGTRPAMTPQRRSMWPQGALKRLERDDRPGVQNARNGLDLLVDEMADVGAVLDIELHQQVEVAGGRINFGCDLGIGQRVGNRIGFAEVAFDLNKKRNHAFLLGPRLRPQSSKTAAR